MLLCTISAKIQIFFKKPSFGTNGEASMEILWSVAHDI